MLVFAACKRHKANLLNNPDKYEDLLNLYKPVVIDTFKVFAASAPDSNAYAFRGIKIDSTTVTLFPAYLTKGRNINDFFATYKFDIDSLSTGLITRAPSEYESSSLLLLIYDKTKNAITDGFELAQTFGDAGDSMEKKAWIYQDENKSLKCLIWEQQSRDERVNNGRDTVSKDTTEITINNYYLIGINRSKHDTLDKNAMALFQKFNMRK